MLAMFCVFFIGLASLITSSLIAIAAEWQGVISTIPFLPTTPHRSIPAPAVLVLYTEEKRVEEK
jgi:hypothetical protein